MAFTETADRLRAEPASGLSLGVDGLFADGLRAERDNIVLKAARALAQHASVTSGAYLTLIKNLPVASGIGGGSADAAAALRLLRRLWRLDIGDATLHGIATTLGADVPVCLASTTSFMGGIGEELSPAPALPPVGVVLINPRVPLITARVFQARNGQFSAPARFSEAPADAKALAALLAQRSNDLEAPAATLVPAITAVLDALRASPGCLLARLSGSGATGFGLYESESAASSAASWIGAREPHWWVVPTRLRG